MTKPWWSYTAIAAPLIGAAAAFLPWIVVTIGPNRITRAGIDGDGLFSLIGFVIVFASLVPAMRGERIGQDRVVLTTACALLAAGVGIYHSGTRSAIFAIDSPGIGVWLTIAAGVLAAITTIAAKAPRTD